MRDEITNSIIVGCDTKNRYNNLYQNLIKRSITENRKLEQQLGKPLNNYDKLYHETTLPFKEDRMLHIRRINIPTFTEKDNPAYYNIILSHIPVWRKGEIKEIYHQCMETVDKQTTNSYTIFQSGKLHGFFPLNENMKYYGIFILNTTDVCDKHIDLLISIIQKNLQRKCDKTKNGCVVFGNLKKDLVRIQEFIDYLDVLKPGMYPFNTNFSSIVSSTTNIPLISSKGGN